MQQLFHIFLSASRSRPRLVPFARSRSPQLLDVCCNPHNRGASTVARSSRSTTHWPFRFPRLDNEISLHSTPVCHDSRDTPAVEKPAQYIPGQLPLGKWLSSIVVQNLQIVTTWILGLITLNE